MQTRLAPIFTMGLLACGSVKSNPDAKTRDSAAIDAPRDARSIDAPPDAPMGPPPQLHWTFDGNTNNTGAVNGFALATPAGISYVAGKVGMAASFGAGQYSNVAGIRALVGSYAHVAIAFWLKEPGTLNSVAVLDCNNRSTAPYGGIQLGLTNTSASMCVSTTSNSFLGGSCGGPTAPSANNWHHWIIRYNGTGTSSGQGGPTQIYLDDVLAFTLANDVANDPVFNTTGMSDTLTLGAPGTMLDDLQIYNQVFDVATQCTQIIGGLYSGSTCTLPP